jgi:hypothetical protein
MRFSASLQHILQQAQVQVQAPLPAGTPIAEKQPAAQPPRGTAPQEPPPDLDQRVRLVGEW